jgi:hypothetical protein
LIEVRFGVAIPLALCLAFQIFGPIAVTAEAVQGPFGKSPFSGMRGTYYGLGGRTRSEFLADLALPDEAGVFRFRLEAASMSISLDIDAQGRLLAGEERFADREIVKVNGSDERRITLVQMGRTSRLRCELFLGGKKVASRSVRYERDDLVVDSILVTLWQRLGKLVQERGPTQCGAYDTYLVVPSQGMRLPVKVELSLAERWPQSAALPLDMDTLPRHVESFWLFTLRLTGVAALVSPGAIYAAYAADGDNALVAFVCEGNQYGEAYIVKP